MSHNQVLLSSLCGSYTFLEGTIQKLFWVYSRTAVFTAIPENEDASSIFKYNHNNLIVQTLFSKTKVLPWIWIGFEHADLGFGLFGGSPALNLV